MTTYRRTTGYFCSDPGDRLLFVPIEGGVGDLERVVALADSGRAVWMELPGSFDTEAVAELLGRGRAEDPERVRRDAAGFVQELVRVGLLVSDETAVDGATASTTEGRFVDPPELARIAGPTARVGGGGSHTVDFVNLAREILIAGSRFRFRARGRSMRPILTDGSVLEVDRVPARWQIGQIALYSVPDHGLVAHRVVRVGDRSIVTLGDSSLRQDDVPFERVIGLVTHRVTVGARGAVPVSAGWRRGVGGLSGRVYRLLLRVARFCVFRPFQASLRRRSLVRRAVAFLWRASSAMLLRIERCARAGRRHADVLRAAFTSAEEKHAERRALYARHGVRAYTASQENMDAGFTLIEEVLVRRRSAERGSVLVLGCGPGREAVAFARLGHEVTGLDFDEGMLQRARVLAAREGVAVRFLEGDAAAFELGREFRLVVMFSGLVNMLLPRERRLACLRCIRDHLEPGGEAWITYLSGYLESGTDPRSRRKSWLEALNPEHRTGDRYLLNETIHIFPHPEELEADAREAGLSVSENYRDQRAYDRGLGQVKGYAVLRRSP